MSIITEFPNLSCEHSVTIYRTALQAEQSGCIFLRHILRHVIEEIPIHFTLPKRHRPAGFTAAARLNRRGYGHTVLRVIFLRTCTGYGGCVGYDTTGSGVTIPAMSTVTVSPLRMVPISSDPFHSDQVPPPSIENCRFQSSRGI